MILTFVFDHLLLHNDFKPFVMKGDLVLNMEEPLSMALFFSVYDKQSSVPEEKCSHLPLTGSHQHPSFVISMSPNMTAFYSKRNIFVRCESSMILTYY